MRTFTLMVASLACAAHSRRVRDSSSKNLTIAGEPNPLSKLAKLLLAVNPSAFSHMRYARRHPSPLVQNHDRFPGQFLRGIGNVKRIRSSNRALLRTSRHSDPLMSAGIAAVYASALATQPVLTKSITSSVSWILSDATAQAIEQSEKNKFDMRRSITCALIGLLYYGPATHYWLDWVTALFPGTSAKSTVLKTLMGQAFFGPMMTIICFGAFLISSDGLRAVLPKWLKKIQQDFLKTWRTELCFWPFVDLIAFTLVPVKWISLVYNAASFLWTIFLSLQASRKLIPQE